MGKENSVRYSGPVSLNESVIQLRNPTLRSLESVPNWGYRMIMGNFLSEIDDSNQERMIGYFVFSGIDTQKRKTAHLNKNKITDKHTEQIPIESRALFETKNLWCSRMALAVIDKENKNKGLGTFLLLNGVARLNKIGVERVIISSTLSSCEFYKKFGAEATKKQYPLELTLETGMIMQYAKYLKEVVGRW